MERRRRFWIAKSAVTLIVVLVVSACGGGDDPGETVVSGRAFRSNQWAAKLQTIGLFLGDSLVASGDIRADGTFLIRAKRTDDMEQAQSAEGFVAFTLRGSSLPSQEAGSYCEGRRDLSLRFESGRWVDADTQAPAFVVFDEQPKCAGGVKIDGLLGPIVP